MIVILATSLSGCQLVEALWLDVAGQLPAEGTCATYQVVATDEQEVTPEILEQTRTVIEHRVNAVGVADPVVVSQVGDRIWVELPGVEDEADIGSLRSLIRTTGVLEFIPVPPELQGLVGEGPLPEGMRDIEPLFTGAEVASAASVQDETTGELVLQLELKDTGARLFDEYAADHFGEQFAIVLDGEVMNAPAILATRFGGQAQISGGTGGFAASEAQSLITVLRFGPLPAEVREVDFGACEGSGPTAWSCRCGTAMNSG
jgi:protein-export membrane protein SecD